jgi:hypothetical protein
MMHVCAAMLALISLLPAPAGAAEQKIRRPAATEVWARTELFFGTNTPWGPVSEEQFADFLNTEITPRFPEGLTLLTAYGQFQDSSGTLIRERSMLLILLYPAGSSDANERIQAIREEYKKRFRQESVLRVDSLAGVSF